MKNSNNCKVQKQKNLQTTIYNQTQILGLHSQSQRQQDVLFKHLATRHATAQRFFFLEWGTGGHWISCNKGGVFTLFLAPLTVPPTLTRVSTVITPHAGWRFSRCGGWAFSRGQHFSCKLLSEGLLSQSRITLHPAQLLVQQCHLHSVHLLQKQQYLFPDPVHIPPLWPFREVVCRRLWESNLVFPYGPTAGHVFLVQICEEGRTGIKVVYI